MNNKSIQSANPLSRIELVFFCLLLVFNLVNIWSVNIYATIDGPCHLYNSGLLNHYAGSNLLKEYFTHNVFYLPNYVQHFIVKSLLLFADPFAAEKIFLSLIVIFIPVSFRYAVSIYAQGVTTFSFLIFSIVFSSLLNLGFYSFMIAFGFFNCQLILLHALFTSQNKKTIAALFILNALVLFYAHPFVFGVAVFITCLMALVQFRSTTGELIRKLIYVLGLYLPALILFLLFYINIPVSSPGPDEPDFTLPHKKFLQLLYFSPAISFSQDELPYSGLMAMLFIFLAAIIIAKRFINPGTEKRLHISDVFLILAILLIPAILFMHNGSLGGMFTDRLVFLFFYFFIFWIACNMPRSKTVLIAAMIITAFTYTKLSEARYGYFKTFSADAEAIAGASAQILNGSVVYVQGYPNSYFYEHLSGYAAVNKDVVLTDNYEAYLGWFPLIWNRKKLDAVQCKVDPADKTSVLPDYVLIYGDQRKIDDAQNAPMKVFLKDHAFPCYRSENDFCRLYKVMKTPPKKSVFK